jgi:hypothetical protein
MTLLHRIVKALDVCVTRWKIRKDNKKKFDAQEISFGQGRPGTEFYWRLRRCVVKIMYKKEA